MNITEMHEGCMARIISDMEGEYFPLKREEKQGDLRLHII